MDTHNIRMNRQQKHGAARNPVWDSTSTRRKFLKYGAFASTSLLVAPALLLGAEKESDGKNGEEPEAEVTPTEDLMREHGVLKRVLLVYRESLRRIDGHQDLPTDALADAAEIIRKFIEDYHEKLEEDHLFPRFENAHRHVDLVHELRIQHQRGRNLTDITLALARPAALASEGDRLRLTNSLRLFIRMYEPHEAREDTVLFPALRQIISRHEFASLGEEFENKEHELFGEDGFESMVDRVSTIEKKLGIYDLAQFTPPA